MPLFLPPMRYCLTKSYNRSPCQLEQCKANGERKNTALITNYINSGCTDLIRFSDTITASMMLSRMRVLALS